MPKRTLFTNITPLPPDVTREVAVAMLHDHDEMIELNPLVIEHHSIKTPRDAPADEFLDCVWQELTDKIHYLPAGMVKGKVSYKACFHDLPMGLQTHIYAPLGLDIREKWSVGGSLPGEPGEPRELGLDVPPQGLYLREDGDMRCSRFLTAFVRKNLDVAHRVLVERILKKAQRIEKHRETMSHQSYQTSNSSNTQSNPSTNTSSSFQTGSHMAKSRIINSPLLNPDNPALSPTHLSATGGGGFGAPNLMDHPAFRAQQQQQQQQQQNHHHSLSSQTQTGNSSLLDPQRQSINAYPYPLPYPTPANGQPPTRQFIAELPGSYYHARNLSTPPLDQHQHQHRSSVATELSSSHSQEVSRNSLAPLTPVTPLGHSEGGSGRGSMSGASDQGQNGINGVNGVNGVNEGYGAYRYNPQDYAVPQPQRKASYAYEEGVVHGKNSNRVSELPAMEMEQIRGLR